MRGKKNPSRKNQVTNVRVVDDYAGSDAAYIERCIAQLQNSHSAMAVLVQGGFLINTSATASTVISGTTTHYNIRGDDDFVSFAQQYNTYRIRAIRFDVYDTASGIIVDSAFSTIHDQTVTYPAPTKQDVLDAPDSQVVPPGTGKISLFWRAKGTLENQFQTCDLGTATVPQDFGGLRYYVTNATTSAQKYQVIFKAVIDFRGRR